MNFKNTKKQYEIDIVATDYLEYGILRMTSVRITSECMISDIDIKETNCNIIPIIDPFYYCNTGEKYHFKLLNPCFQIRNHNNYKRTLLSDYYDNILLVKDIYDHNDILYCVWHYINKRKIPEFIDVLFEKNPMKKKFITMRNKIYDHMCKFKAPFTCHQNINYNMPMQFDPDTLSIYNSNIRLSEWYTPVNFNSLIAEHRNNPSLCDSKNFTKGINYNIKYKGTYSNKILNDYFFYNYREQDNFMTNKTFEIQKGRREDSQIIKEIIFPIDVNLFDIESIIFGVTGQENHWVIPFDIVIRNAEMYQDNFYIHLSMSQKVMSGCYDAQNYHHNFYGFNCLSFYENHVYVRINSRKIHPYKLRLCCRNYNDDTRLKSICNFLQLIHIYQKISFVDQMHISFKMFGAHEYDGFYINFFRNPIHDIKMKIFVDDRILIKFDARSLDKYVKNFVIDNGVVTSAKFTNLHRQSLYECLSEHLPIEIISMIEDFIEPNVYSMYYIPFEFFNSIYQDRYN